jgi:hypothetical protein
MSFGNPVGSSAIGCDLTTRTSSLVEVQSRPASGASPPRSSVVEPDDLAQAKAKLLVRREAVLGQRRA